MIAELIFDWAQRTPEKTAVIYNKQPWSYRVFAEQIAVARRYFLRRGYAGPGYAVLASVSHLDFWVLSLALRSLGLTTVIVSDAKWLAELELPDIRCVVARSGEAWSDLAALCNARGLTLISASLEKESVLHTAPHEAGHEPGGHILLTSGTTGRYKMVLSTPAIDNASLRLIVEVLGMSQDTVFSVFNFAAWTGIGYRWAASPWLVGGTTLIEGREPYRAFLNHRLTHAVLAPSVLDQILAAPTNGYQRNDALQLVVGGGALTRHQIEQTKARITPRIFTTIASTEVGSFTYTALETPEDSRWHRLLPQRVVEVVSESGEAVPTGEIGRLRVGTQDGPTSYLGDETATKLQFKGGYFYPGDLAFTRPDGRIALQGRSTSVINVRGIKILPEPIEERLCELLDVCGVCLLSMQNESGEEELYVAIETSQPIDAERLRVSLSGALESFPTVHVRYLPSLPRNQMGKVLRDVLRAQVTAAP